MNKTNILQVNNKIINLINSEENKWKTQKKNLETLLTLHNNFIDNNNLDNPTIEILNQLEDIKTWRTNNLNTRENMNDDRYGKEIAMKMCEFKVQLMTQVYKNNK